MAETKVILTKSVNHLSPATSWPSSPATPATTCSRRAWPSLGPGAAAQIEAMKRARLAKAVATREEAVAAKEIIEGSTVEIAAKVSESGKLFGGISAEKIAIALSSKVEVNPKNITVEPIKTTGDFPATVALHPEITANFFVKVVAE